MTLFSIALVLFLIMDPVGNIGSFISQLSSYTTKEKYWVIFREMSIALAIMLLFNFIGEYIFAVLQISETVVRLTSGAILFLMALQILYPSINSLRANLPKEKPFLTPLAIPLIAGPCLLATIMLYAHMEDSQAIMLYAIVIAWAAALVIILLSSQIQRLVGNSGLYASERLMGMILVMIGIQRFMEGVQLFIEHRGIVPH